MLRSLCRLLSDRTGRVEWDVHDLCKIVANLHQRISDLEQGLSDHEEFLVHVRQKSNGDLWYKESPVSPPLPKSPNAITK
jgi:hypothetical protein